MNCCYNLKILFWCINYLFEKTTHRNAFTKKVQGFTAEQHAFKNLYTSKIYFIKLNQTLTYLRTPKGINAKQGQWSLMLLICKTADRDTFGLEVSQRLRDVQDANGVEAVSWRWSGTKELLEGCWKFVEAAGDSTVGWRVTRRLAGTSLCSEGAAARNGKCGLALLVTVTGSRTRASGSSGSPLVIAQHQGNL